MRTPTTGRGLHPERTIYTRHLWPLDDSAIGSNSPDIAMGSAGQLTYPGGANNPTLTLGNVGSALAFGTNKYVEGPSGDDSQLRDTWTFDAWVYLPQGAGGPIASYTVLPSSGLEADNTLFDLNVNSNGTLTLLWQEGAGTNVSMTSQFTVPHEQWFHVMIVCETLLVRNVFMYINGDLAESFNGKNLPTGGGNSNWYLGTSDSGTDFTGSICSVRVSAFGLAASDARSAFRRGMAWEPENFDIRLRVKVEQGGPGNIEIDLTDFRNTDWVEAVEISDTIDAQNRTATVRFGRDIFNAESLAPLMLNSPANLADSGGGPRPSDPGPDDLDSLPALDLWHNITIEAARIPMGNRDVGSTDWQNIFYGRIDRIDWPNDSVVITARDQVAQLTDKFLTTFGNEYGGAPPAGRAMETVIQDILTAESTGFTLNTPVSPGFQIDTYTQKAETIMDAITTMADLIGWNLRYRWSEDAGEFKLTLYDPQRDRLTVDATFEATDYFQVSRMSTDLSTVRNQVRITYKDRNGASQFVTRQATDVDPTSTSVTDYGARWMAVGEKATEHIKTQSEANDMADIILRDLMEPYATKSLTLRSFFELTVGDRVKFEANNIHYSEPLYGAIMNLSHRFENGSATTTVELRGRPASGHHKHIDKGAGPRTGSYIPPGRLADVSTALGDRAKAIPTQVQIEQGLSGPLVSDASVSTPNPYFSIHLDYDNQCFDGWTPDTGSTWGSSNDVYWTTSDQESGDRSLVLLTQNAAVVTLILQPVIQGQCMTVYARWKGDNVADTLSGKVRFYDASRALISTSTAWTEACKVAGSFQTDDGTVAPPSNARFAAIVLERTTAPVGGSLVTIDRSWMSPTNTSFYAYLVTDQTAIAAGTAETVQLDDTQSETYDYCGNFSNATYTFTVPESGIYRFEGKVTFRGNPSGTKIDNAHVELYKNGSSWLEVESVEYDGGGSRGTIEVLFVTPPIRVAGGDTIKMVGQVNVDDFDLIAGVASTWLSGTLVRNRYS